MALVTSKDQIVDITDDVWVTHIFHIHSYMELLSGKERFDSEVDLCQWSNQASHLEAHLIKTYGVIRVSWVPSNSFDLGFTLVLFA
jgi:hypothetical protein